MKKSKPETYQHFYWPGIFSVFLNFQPAKPYTMNVRFILPSLLSSSLFSFSHSFPFLLLSFLPFSLSLPFFSYLIFFSSLPLPFNPSFIYSGGLPTLSPLTVWTKRRDIIRKQAIIQRWYGYAVFRYVHHIPYFYSYFHLHFYFYLLWYDIINEKMIMKPQIVQLNYINSAELQYVILFEY